MIVFQEILAKFYQAIIVALAVILLFSLSFGGFFYFKSAHYQGKYEKSEQVYKEAKADLERKQFIALNEKQVKINKLSQDYENEKSKYKIKVETVTKQVQKIVERPIYRNVCIDADGLQSINSIITKAPS